MVGRWARPGGQGRHCFGNNHFDAGLCESTREPYNAAKYNLYKQQTTNIDL